jgi:hypothetical protein
MRFSAGNLLWRIVVARREVARQVVVSSIGKGKGGDEGV